MHVAPQRVEIEHPHAAVLDPDQAVRLQRVQCLVDPLARQADQVGQFLLGDAQHLADAGTTVSQLNPSLSK